MDLVVMAPAVTLSHLLTICPSALLGESDFVPLSHHRHRLVGHPRCLGISLGLRVDDHSIEDVLGASHRCEGRPVSLLMCGSCTVCEELAHRLPVEEGCQLVDLLTVAGFRILQGLLEVCVLVGVVTLAHDHLLFEARDDHCLAVVELLGQVGDLGSRGSLDGLELSLEVLIVCDEIFELLP